MDSRIRGAIIPHANKKYCGDIRSKIFKKLSKDTDFIIYIASLHKVKESDKVFLIHKTLGFPEIKLNFTPIDYLEHSYYWVEKELNSYFPKVKLLVIAPDKNINFTKLSIKIKKFLQINPKTLVIATTDLIHYGNQFDNLGSLMFPEQMNKILYEEELIDNLIKKPINGKKIINIITSNNFLTCGTYAILLFSLIMEKLNWYGKVVDYYDSYSSQKKDLLDRYIISPYKLDSFVSYVGIIYSSNLNQNKISSFDIFMALGLIKSNIIFNTLGLSTRSLRLPNWSPLNRIFGGVFVGSETPEGKTNCCYGRFENKTSVAIKIKEASDDCFKDAETRWVIPYQKNLLNHYLYKLELLDNKKKWKRIDAKKIKERFNLDSNQGIYLTLEDGKSATFLPIVSRQKPKWNIETYMNQLSLKAGGHFDDWKTGQIYIYGSKEYTWNIKKQKIIRK